MDYKMEILNSLYEKGIIDEELYERCSKPHITKLPYDNRSNDVDELRKRKNAINEELDKIKKNQSELDDKLVKDLNNLGEEAYDFLKKNTNNINIHLDYFEDEEFQQKLKDKESKTLTNDVNRSIRYLRKHINNLEKNDFVNNSPNDVLKDRKLLESGDADFKSVGFMRNLESTSALMSSLASNVNRVSSTSGVDSFLTLKNDMNKRRNKIEDKYYDKSNEYIKKTEKNTKISNDLNMELEKVNSNIKENQ